MSPRLQDASSGKREIFSAETGEHYLFHSSAMQRTRLDNGKESRIGKGYVHVNNIVISIGIKMLILGAKMF